jgi:hypothetical protein
MANQTSAEQIHQEHRQWNRQHVHWLEDLERWVKDLDLAADKLRWTLEHLGRLGKAYAAHRETMVAQEQEAARHELHLKQGKLDPHDAGAHELSRRAQAYQQSFHEALRLEHESFVTLVGQLEAVVAAASLR